jgi:hypothetical protein
MSMGVFMVDRCMLQRSDGAGLAAARFKETEHEHLRKLQPRTGVHRHGNRPAGPAVRHHLLQPGVAEAVLRNDSSLCNSTNPLAWEKLRGLLVLHYHVVAENAAADGVEAAAETVRQALERVRPGCAPSSSSLNCPRPGE